MNSAVAAWLVCALAFNVAGDTTSRPASGTHVKITGETMGTTYTIKADGAAIDQEEIKSEIDARLAVIDERMSTYRQDSEISRFNRAPAGSWFPVHPETAMIVSDMAGPISEQTGGAFDITVGPLVGLWSFGANRAREGFTPPSDQRITEALSVVGFNKLETRGTDGDQQEAALRKTVDGLHIDLSAIAKGYAVDVISELLMDHGIDSFMVEIGGEVRVHGAHADGSPWRIGVEAPERGARRVGSVVSLQDEAMATSGDYRNFFEHEGTTYSHTIDPHTGRPVAHNLASVTVIANTCAQSDALATAILVMGPEKGFRWAREHGVKALLVSRDGDTMSQRTTAGFPSDSIDEPQSSQSYGLLLVVTAVVFAIAMLAMSLGTIVANRRLQGSCGGLAGLKDERGVTVCDLCTRPSPECSGEPGVGQG